MCLPLVLLVMALPSLTGQTRSAPHLDTRASDEPWITWDNLWTLPVGYLVAALLLIGWAWWRERKR
jgi:hypothetical protein